MADTETFLEQLDREWAEVPRYRKAYYACVRKLTSTRLRRARRAVRHGWQRVRRGYSDADTWSFDDHLAMVIAGALRQLQRRTHGHPASMTATEWEDTLGTIAFGFERYRRDMELMRYSDATAHHLDESFRLLRKHYMDLWD